MPLQPSSLVKRFAPAVVAALVVISHGDAVAQTTPKSGDAKKDTKKNADKSEKGKDKKAASDKDADASAQQAPKSETAPPAPSEQKERKRAVYVLLDAGLLHSDIAGLSDNTGIDKTAASGLSYSFGGGVRFEAVQLGAKFHGFSTTEYEFWSVMAEAGYGLPLRPFEPIFFAHAGYIWNVGLERAAIGSSLPPGNFLEPKVGMRGAVVGVEAVGAYWVNEIVRLGPFIGADLTFLHRDQAGLPTSVLPGAIPDDIRAKPLYTDSGSGVGYQINLGIRGSVDLAF